MSFKSTLFKYISNSVLLALTLISFLLPTTATFLTYATKFQRISESINWMLRSIVAFLVLTTVVVVSAALAPIFLPVAVALHLGGLVSIWIVVYYFSSSLGWVCYPLVPASAMLYEWLYVAFLVRIARNQVQGFRRFISDYFPASWVNLIMEAEQVGAPAGDDDNGVSLLNSLDQVSQHFKQVSNYSHRGYERVPMMSESNLALETQV